MNGVIDRFENRVTKQMDYKTRRRIKKGAFYLSMGFWMVILIIPLYWMFLSSFLARPDLYTIDPSLIPTLSELTWINYEVLTQTRVAQLFLNTLIIASGVMSLSVSVSTVAGYGLTRYDFPFKVSFARIILAGYMLAPIVIAIPMFIIFRSTGLLNSYLGVILAQSSAAIPFSVWVMWKLFQSISITQEEAAWMSGASRFRTFKDIALPNAKPGIMAVSLFAFAIVWNDFTFSRILLPATEKTTLSPGLMVLAQQGQYLHEGNVMAIGVVMSIIPIAVAYWLQNYLLAGFQIGG